MLENWSSKRLKSKDFVYCVCSGDFFEKLYLGISAYIF